MYTNTSKIEYVLYKICTVAPQSENYLVRLSLMM